MLSKDEKAFLISFIKTNYIPNWDLDEPAQIEAEKRMITGIIKKLSK